MKKIIIGSLVVITISCLSPLPGCNNGSHRDTAEGRELAQSHCKSCHQLPEPALLDKKTWENHVLPKMGRLLGFLYLEPGGYLENGNAVMKREQWNEIVRYYVIESPKELVNSNNKMRPISMGLKQFTTHIPSSSTIKPAVTLVKVDPAQKHVFSGDGSKKTMYILSGDAVIDSFPVGVGVAQLRVKGNDLLACTMGVLHPSDSKSGNLVAIDAVSKKTYTVLDSLQRPVHASYADVNADGLEDIILCEFGNYTGQLSWFENKGEKKYTRHVLRALPGAVKTEVVDFNNDGKPDILALMAQGDEGFFIYYNQGGAAFKEQRVLRMPPSYGSNYFELADFNNDGFPDIVYTNGDNGDYPPILKGYHGIRIYLNNGRNQFEEKLFLPVNGVAKAIARDFDGDGDLDLASIAYFPDYEHTPEEAFIYWENKGKFMFTPSSFKEVNAGRWLSMDAGDMDGDGDQDIVLGNATFSLGYVPEQFRKKWNAKSPSILVLENILR